MDDAELGRTLGEVAVTYTVKELLARIETRQIQVEAKIDGLATTAEVTALEVIVRRHEARWNRVIGAAIAVSTLCGGVAGYLANVLAAAGN